MASVVVNKPIGLARNGGEVVILIFLIAGQLEHRGRGIRVRDKAKVVQYPGVSSRNNIGALAGCCRNVSIRKTSCLSLSQPLGHSVGIGVIAHEGGLIRADIEACEGRDVRIGHAHRLQGFHIYRACSRHP